jgi:hypothetical protein
MLLLPAYLGVKFSIPYPRQTAAVREPLITAHHQTSGASIWLSRIKQWRRQATDQWTRWAIITSSDRVISAFSLIVYMCVCVSAHFNWSMAALLSLVRHCHPPNSFFNAMLHRIMSTHLRNLLALYTWATCIGWLQHKINALFIGKSSGASRVVIDISWRHQTQHQDLGYHHGHHLYTEHLNKLWVLLRS